MMIKLDQLVSPEPAYHAAVCLELHNCDHLS